MRELLLHARELDPGLGGYPLRFVELLLAFPDDGLEVAHPRGRRFRGGASLGLGHQGVLQLEPGLLIPGGRGLRVPDTA